MNYELHELFHQLPRTCTFNQQLQYHPNIPQVLVISAAPMPGITTPAPPLPVLRGSAGAPRREARPRTRSPRRAAWRQRLGSSRVPQLRRIPQLFGRIPQLGFRN